MKKLGVIEFFFMRSRGVTKKSRDYWVTIQILMKILFKEIASKRALGLHISSTL